MNKEKLTNPDGVVLENDNNSITGKGIGNTYTFLEDKYLIEKLAHFVRERIPERVVHAKGAGAHGYFLCTNDMSNYTKACIFKKDKKTPVFVRFSTVGGELGSADTVRDPRGFAIKFYSEEGNYDIVGNNTPIFFIRDAMKFPDFIHTQKRNPKTHLKDPNMMWDFLSLTPESLHQVTILFSDRGTPMTYRHMHGFSSHAFMWYKNEKEYFWVKYHFLTNQGIKNWTDEESIKMAGENPDFATQDLYESIQNKHFPSWTLKVQILKPNELNKLNFDPFDVTKTWPHDLFPLIEVGQLILDKNPVDYFAEVEQAAFSPARFIPGVYSSPDKMLQGRLFAYEDAHRHRLGANYQQIPINSPKMTCPFSNQRDGFMTVNQNFEGKYHYSPSTLDNSFEVDENNNKVPNIEIDNFEKGRYSYELNDIDFEQPRILFEEVFDDQQRERLVSNMSKSLSGAMKKIQYRWVSICYRASKDYGNMLSNKLALNIEKVQELANCTQKERVEKTLSNESFNNL